MRNKRWIYGSLAILCLATLPLQSCKEETRMVKPATIDFKKEGELVLKTASDSIIARLDIEIADDEYQTQTGLMYRDGMEEHQGMLFIFPKAEFHSFYMKNTRFALDIIYFDEQKTLVSIQKNAEPFNEDPLPSLKPAQYVLEVNAGLTDAWQLQVGDQMEFKKIDN